MKKSLPSRIAILAVVYCAAFFFLVIIQFSNQGGFSQSVGSMTIRGRYEITPSALNNEDESHSAHPAGAMQITGGIRLYYGGLEFSLNEVRGKGLTINENGISVPVNPETMEIDGTQAIFGLPGGSSLSFLSFVSERGQDLQISAEFAETVTEIIIPITVRRSSIVREDDQLGVAYAGSRFLFSSGGQELENGFVILSQDNAVITYRARVRQKEFDPAVYTIAGANNYESVFLNWRELSYIQWNQNAYSLQNDLEAAGYITEALGRGNYNAAVNSMSREFINSQRHSFRSASFAGGMVNAYRTFLQTETSKYNAISSFVREKSESVLKEEHLIDYLFIRSETSLAYDVIDIIHNLTPESITIDLCPGLLEVSLDIKKWRPAANNPIESITERILAVISENLIRDTENDLVFASNSENTAEEFSLRLGKALMGWGQNNQDTDWQEIGKSLALSALTSGGPGEGRLYSIINEEANYPKAVWLLDNGIWTWTAASQARASYIGSNINISFSFPAGQSHYVIIRGIRPFIKIQIHGMDWRTDWQFENYNSSGWVYYPESQILILKLRHEQTVENVGIFYWVEPVPVIEETETAENTEEEYDNWY